MLERSGRAAPGHATPLRWLGAVGLLVLAAAAVAAVRWGWWARKPPPPDPNALPPLASSPYRNTGPDAEYVGADACRACHEDAHASFRATGMGRSMAEVDPGREPPDAAFDHPASKRRYQVVRKDGRLWHRELLLGSPSEVVLAEYPLTHVVGSGRHSRTYLAEPDGLMVESPVTWYASRQAWGMSPGYDSPGDAGFQRGVGQDCLFCHAGRAEAVDQSFQRMHILEEPIGCERCHGPGSLHVAAHAGRTESGRGAAADLTIVNPARLPRDLAEAVCQQCHLRPTAVVAVRGRGLPDFRPGLPLRDYVQAYQLDESDKPMTVVGHVEQLHLSRCYQGSDKLTCVTCHDPHGEPAPEDRVAYYNAVCTGCHRPERCTVAPERRRRESPDNNCIQCHMPQSPTDIPHLAFTHHRIGIHDGRPAAAAPPAGDLRPFFDDSEFGEADRKRMVGLASLDVAGHAEYAALHTRLESRAMELMSDARAAGLRDGVLDAGLARLYYENGSDLALPYAESALTHADLNGPERCAALIVVAGGRAKEGRVEEAIDTLHRLTRLRRHPADWLLLADCERRLGDPAAEQEALEEAVRIDPRLWQVQRDLAERYRRHGDPARAAWRQERAVP